MFKKDDVGRAPVDYFSWGHINMGIVTFLLWSLCNLLPSAVVGTLLPIVPFWFSIVLTIVVAVVWEIMENTLFIDLGIKFEGKRDSLTNAIFDIIFVIVGGLVMWGIKSLIVNVIMGVDGIVIFYIVGVITFVAVLIGFFIGRSMTK
jgi:hypothetical protein